MMIANVCRSAASRVGLWTNAGCLAMWGCDPGVSEKMKLTHYAACWLQLLLLLSGSLRPWAGVIADQATGEAGDQPGSAPALVATNCPAELVLSLLKDSRQLQRAISTGDDRVSGSSNSQTQSPVALPSWPPPALKQGLSCTMELSQLSVALPGTKQVCTVLSITNNLLSTLYSWQLVFTSKGLAPSSATGAVLLNITGSGDSTVQLINPSTSSSIAARGGSVDMLVQLGLIPSSAPKAPPTDSAGGGAFGSDPPPPPSPTPQTPQPGSKGRPPSKPRSAPKPPGGMVKPAVESVYLNGLQCTRLPLARPALGPVDGAEGLYLDDCGTVEWGLSANGTFLSAPGQESLGSLGSWEVLNLTSSGNGPFWNQSVGVGAMLAAVWQLSCVSQLCCGLQVLPSSVVNLTDAANGTEPPVLAADGPTPAKSLSNNTTPSSPAPESLPADITPPPQPVQTGGSSIEKTAGLVAGLVVAGVVVACMGAMLVVMVWHRRKRLLMEEKMQAAAAAAAAQLVRHGSGASTGSGGAASLASAASAEWQQQQQLYTTPFAGRPPMPWLRGGPQQALPTHHTAPPHLISAAAAAATGELSASGGVWRAGSWQGPDAYVADGAQLTRTSSSPSPLLRTTTASTAASSQPTRPALPLPGSSNPSSPSMALLHLPPAGPSRSNSHPSPSLGAAAAGASSGAGGTAAGTFGVTSAASTANSSLGSTWGVMRYIMGGGRVPPPKSSTLASNSSTVLMRHGSQAAIFEASEGTATHSNALSAAAALAAAMQGEQSALGYYRPPLQLIQEAAPLAGSGSAHALGQQQLQLLASTGASTYLGGMLSGAAGEGGSVAVSRRISPILSVHEDASSATSTDSMTPAAWQLTDRQLLEDTPGWLNIDFASEVRLEKKLGEGGFGQVFRARWRDEVIAAKLVPFMSLVAQQHHSMGLSLVSAAPDAAAAAAAAGGQQALGSHNGSAASQLSSMRLGVQFSSASLRAIKIEIRVLSQLSHPNIVSFKGACLAPPHICILEELAEGGSLHSRLYSRSSASKAQQRQQQAPAAANAASSSSSPSPAQPRPRKAHAGGSSSRSQLPLPLTVAEVLHIALDVTQAMVYLHTLAPQVVHRDLKPQNVLLDLQGRAKVCDFGISKMKDASLAASSTRLQAGTPAYMAPEQFEGCSVTDKVDVFAFAVMLWECFEQQQPWKELSPMQIIYSVGLQKERLQRPARCPDMLWQLIEACWAQDPRNRPSFADIQQNLQHIQQQLAETQQGGTSANSSGQHKDSSLHVQQQQLPQQPVVKVKAGPLQQQQQQTSGKLPSQAASAQRQPVEESEEVDAHVAVVC